jgi:hypothetical protein
MLTDDLARDGAAKLVDVILAELPEDVRQFVAPFVPDLVSRGVLALGGWLAGLVSAGHVRVTAPSAEVHVHEGARPPR